MIETNKKGVLPLYYSQEEDAVYITAPDPVYLEVPVEVEKTAAALGVNRDTIENK